MKVFSVWYLMAWGDGDYTLTPASIFKQVKSGFVLLFLGTTAVPQPLGFVSVF